MKRNPQRKTAQHNAESGSADVDIVPMRTGSDKVSASLRIGMSVRIIRERLEWRQIDLAKRAGVAANTINGLEAGRKTHQRNIEKIAKALGTTAEALWRGQLPDEATELASIAADLRTMCAVAMDIARKFDKARTSNLEVKRTFAERLANLEPHRQATVLEVLQTEEDDQRNAFAGYQLANDK